MEKEFCNNCGKEVLTTDNYCKICGNFVDGSSGGSQTKPDTPTASVTVKPKQAMRGPAEFIPKRHLGADAIIFFFVQLWGKSFLLFVLALVGAALQPWPFVLILGVYFLAVLIVALLTHTNYTFEISDDGLLIEQGILHRYHVSVPYEQIQNVNIERTLLDRFLGFSKISIETAGAAAVANGTIKSPKAEAFIPGLHHEEANRIHNLLIDGADGVPGD